VGDKTIELPCCGVFELRDGKIGIWRDYFDMNSYVQALEEVTVAVRAPAATQLHRRMTKVDRLSRLIIMHIPATSVERSC